MSIKKIAELVGVSSSTVSRVLRDSDHKCLDEKTKEKILKTARSLEYTPNAAARNLKYGKEENLEKKYINILKTREDYDPFYSQILRIIEIYAINQGFIISNVWYNSSFSNLSRATSVNLNKTLDEMFSKPESASHGLIILGKCDEEVIKELKKRCKHIVSINRNSTKLSIDEVLCDGCKLSSTAIEYLISLGHRKIGYVGDTINESRFIGYQNTLFKYNINTDLNYVYSDGLGYEYGRTALEYFTRLADPPTAIYCSNDTTALGMLNHMNKIKNRYYNPSIISSDNIDESAHSKPMLTTVNIPKELMVKYALELLRDKMDGGHKEKIKIEFEGRLIIRESCSKTDNSMLIEYYI